MGCSIKPQYKKFSTNPAQDSRIIVHPGSFVLENEHSFHDIYRLSSLLGTGTFGEVRICVHRSSGVKRAVKIIRKDLLTSAHQRASLDNEINILKLLDHPNIIRLNEFFEEVKRLYIVMEYCKGGELFGEIVKRGSLTETQAASIMKQIFLTLEYLHGQGIVHRDIKPENILMEERHDIMHIKLIDFGTAVINQTALKMKGNAGTLYYMSPEILLGDYTMLCDIWSAGVIMYIILSGFPPFEGRDNREIVENIHAGKYDMHGEPWPKISEAAKSLVRKLLCAETSRLSSKQALEDAWITDNSTTTHSGIMGQVLANLRNFRAASMLREAIRTFITTQYISADEIREFKEIFMNIDRDHDGKISYQELVEVYKKSMDEEEAREIVDRVMNEVDSDRNGFIEYSEFLKANLDMKKIMSGQNLEAAFRMFDSDGNGKISPDEMKRILQGDNIVDEQIWAKIIGEFDIDGDGEIDMKEFEVLVKKGEYLDPGVIICL